MSINDWNESQQLLFYKVKSLNSEVQALVASRNGLNEALKRATYETNIIPGEIKKLSDKIDALVQQGQQMYQELKDAIGCPDGHEINFETGEFEPAKSGSTGNAQ